MLQPGQSEVDTLTVRFPSLEKEITTWDTYQLSTTFTDHVSTCSFVLSTNSPTPYNAILQGGAKIEVLSNGKPQFTGYIDRISKSSSRSNGLVYQVSAKDILGPVVGATLDPQTKITGGQTVADLVYGVLSEFGIKKVYIGDAVNYNIMTGFRKGEGGPTTRTFTSKELSTRKDPVKGVAELVFIETKVTEVVSNTRRDLKAIPSDQRKPHIGDGAMEVIDRFLKRLGLHMWAAADGSGVVIDAPDYEAHGTYKLLHTFDGAGTNNVLDAKLDEASEMQPSAVVAKGFGGGGELPKSSMVCVAINELVAVDASTKQPIKSTANLAARYPRAKVLPLRDQLIPQDNRLVSVFTQKPIYLKDDESKTIDQLAAFTRRALSRYQGKYQTYSCTVKGHTYQGAPWAVNTIVDVQDDYLGLHGPMWVLSRTFAKGRSGGTTTQLTLIKPFTYVLGD